MKQFVLIYNIFNNFCRGIPEKSERTPEEYDSLCDKIENGEPETEPGTRKRKRRKMKKYGVKERCIFNSLESFHCMNNQMPFDFLHDWLEKVGLQGVNTNSGSEII
jgi:hypothetical protein